MKKIKLDSTIGEVNCLVDQAYGLMVCMIAAGQSDISEMVCSRTDELERHMNNVEEAKKLVSLLADFDGSNADFIEVFECSKLLNVCSETLNYYMEISPSTGEKPTEIDKAQLMGLFGINRILFDAAKIMNDIIIQSDLNAA
ncbi:hypothetical protein [Aliiglaciecola aliphaticivorans]